MSYNIDNVATPYLDAYMDAADIVRLAEDHDWLPEGCFIQNHYQAAKARLAKGIKCAACESRNDLDAAFCKKCGAALAGWPDVSHRIKLKNLSWYGEGSGRAYEDHFIKDVAPLIHGRVDAIFTWEGGDSVTGLRIKDGVATECKVEMRLVEAP